MVGLVTDRHTEGKTYNTLNVNLSGFLCLADTTNRLSVLVYCCVCLCFVIHVYDSISMNWDPTLSLSNVLLGVSDSKRHELAWCALWGPEKEVCNIHTRWMALLHDENRSKSAQNKELMCNPVDLRSGVDTADQFLQSTKVVWCADMYKPVNYLICEQNTDISNTPECEVNQILLGLWA